MDTFNLSDWDAAYNDSKASFSKMSKYIEPVLKMTELDVLGDHVSSTYISYASSQFLALVILAICLLLVTWKVSSTTNPGIHELGLLPMYRHFFNRSPIISSFHPFTTSQVRPSPR